MALPAALLDALRSLQPVVYVRAEDPQALLAEVAAFAGTRSGVFVTTMPDTTDLRAQFTCRPSESEQFLLDQGVPVPGRRFWAGMPLPEALNKMVESDPKHGRGLALCHVNEGLTPSECETLTRFADKRFQDHFWVMSTILVGTGTARDAVPSSLRSRVCPIDLVGPAREGPDDLERAVASDDDLRALFKVIASKLNSASTLSESGLYLCRGIELAELHMAIAMAAMRFFRAARKAGEKDTHPTEDDLLSAVWVHRLRWARVT